MRIWTPLGAGRKVVEGSWALPLPVKVLFCRKWCHLCLYHSMSECSYRFYILHWTECCCHCESDTSEGINGVQDDKPHCYAVLNQSPWLQGGVRVQKYNFTSWQTLCWIPEKKLHSEIGKSAQIANRNNREWGRWRPKPMSITWKSS